MNGPWYCVSFSFISNLRAIFDVFQENFMLFICLQCTFVDPKRSLWFVRVMPHNSLAPPHPFQCDVARCITSNKVKSSRGTMKCLFCFFVQMLQLLGRRKTKIKFWSGTYKAPSNAPVIQVWCLQALQHNDFLINFSSTSVFAHNLLAVVNMNYCWGHNFKSNPSTMATTFVFHQLYVRHFH